MERPGDVLFVDDDPRLRNLAIEWFGREVPAVRVDAVDGADAALEALAGAEYDCIVSDYEMSDLDGLELLQRVREDHPDLPFVLFTGAGDEAVASRAISAGVTDYVRKHDGTDSFELLANRVTNAIEADRARRRAADLDRVNEVIRTVLTRVYGADTREDVERVTCEALADADPYRFAWIGAPDPETGRLVPRAVSGPVAEDYIETATVRTDETPEGTGPGGRAYRIGEPQVVGDVADDPDFEPWREGALEHGVRSVAALPLVAGETTYGVLGLYAGRVGAFDEAELDVLTDLTEMVSSRLAALEYEAGLVERARRHEDREAVLERIDEAVVALDTEWRVTYLNDAAESLLGYGDDELVGQNVWEVFPGAVDAGIVEWFQRALETGESTTRECYYEPLGGWYRASIYPSDTGLSVYVRDVTDEREAMARADRERRLIETAFETVEDVFYVLGPEGEEIQRVNDYALSITGCDPGEVEGTAPLEAFHEDDRETVAEAIETVLETGEASTVEARLLTADDGPVRYEFTGAPIYEDGTVVGICGVGRDVSDRRRREEQLAELHETSRRMAAATDRSAVVSAALEAFSSVLGFPITGIWLHDETTDRLEPAGHTEAASVLLGPQPIYERGESVFWEVFETGDPRVLDDLDAVEGSYRGDTVLGSGIVVPLEGHGVVNVASRAVEAFDATDLYFVRLLSTNTVAALERTARERELHEREEHLARQNDRLERLASMVSHDLRNPLSAAIGYADLARETGDTEYFDRLETAHDRMNVLIEDILSLTRKGELVEDPDPVSLCRTARRAWGSVDTRAADLVVESDPTIRAAADRLRQILENLFANAVTHGGADVEVRVGALAAPGDGNGAEGTGFYVEDSGAGIDIDDPPRVFEARYSAGEGGSGLGLTIVQELAEAHGWSVTVGESADGGARFGFTGVEPADAPDADSDSGAEA